MIMKIRHKRAFTIIITLIAVTPFALLQWCTTKDSVFYEYQVGTFALLLGMVIIGVRDLLARNNFSVKEMLKKPTTYVVFSLDILLIAFFIFTNLERKSPITHVFYNIFKTRRCA